MLASRRTGQAEPPVKRMPAPARGMWSGRLRQFVERRGNLCGLALVGTQEDVMNLLAVLPELHGIHAGREDVQVSRLRRALAEMPCDVARPFRLLVCAEFEELAEAV